MRINYAINYTLRVLHFSALLIRLLFFISGDYEEDEEEEEEEKIL